jgi:hypothetical protein
MEMILASTPAVDKTIEALGRGLLSRDLYQTVPVPSDAIEEYVYANSGLHKLHAIADQFGAGADGYHLVHDRLDFRMFAADRRKWTYFVDEDGGCAPVHLHEELKDMWDEHPKPEYRLYTVREAVVQIRDEVLSHRRH